MRTTRAISLVFRGRRFEIPQGARVARAPGRPTLRHLADIHLFIDPVLDERRYKDAVAEGVEVDIIDVEGEPEPEVAETGTAAAPNKQQLSRDSTTFGAVDVGQRFWDPDSHTWMRKASPAEALILGADTRHPELVEFEENEAVVSAFM